MLLKLLGLWVASNALLALLAYLRGLIADRRRHRRVPDVAAPRRGSGRFARPAAGSPEAPAEKVPRGRPPARR